MHGISLGAVELRRKRWNYVLCIYTGDSERVYARANPKAPLWRIYSIRDLFLFHVPPPTLSHLSPHSDIVKTLKYALRARATLVRCTIIVLCSVSCTPTSAYRSAACAHTIPSHYHRNVRITCWFYRFLSTTPVSYSRTANRRTRTLLGEISLSRFVTIHYYRVL